MGQRFEPGDALPRPPFFELVFEEAVAWARARGVALPEDFYGALQQIVVARAFTVAGLATLDQIQGVLDSLTRATASGETFRQWRDALPGDALALSPSRLELIFRNALQTHYGVGRSIQQRSNAASRPFLMWDAINDSRTRETHAAMDNHIAPIDDPVWQRWSPPAGHNCRCTRISLTRRQAEQRGYTGASAPDVDPDDGWGGDPSLSDADLRGVIEGRLDACSTVNPPPVWCTEEPARELLAGLLSALDDSR